MSEPRPYRPSNSDEGMWFIGKFCISCIHGKYEHSQDPDDNPCEILSMSFLADAKEWIYDENDKPTCTEFKKFEWIRDEEGNFIDPPPAPDPNQLSINFPI